MGQYLCLAVDHLKLVTSPHIQLGESLRSFVYVLANIFVCLTGVICLQLGTRLRYVLSSLSALKQNSVLSEGHLVVFCWTCSLNLPPRYLYNDVEYVHRQAFVGRSLPYGEGKSCTVYSTPVYLSVVMLSL